jgi:hypothetical protein
MPLIPLQEIKGANNNPFGATVGTTVRSTSSRAQSTGRPTIAPSTSSVMINEKARILREEISSLDNEINGLQKNLRKAIEGKELTTI